ncbi:hypothetical protein [Streptomyces violaceus]|uniref:Uncharacterized protein n=1 Tax=Streptomyces violaceus TaxID=1936 RepID=A0ABY9U1S5_STRVL|nr:hypothetical protein [Streptomyces janthinus]WND16227.1 hypothetical protein RI060_02160 [Streptomyces janthinus]GGS90066.1 hypothetical protein GCM10010270_72800 [Streptomyces janthinus]
MAKAIANPISPENRDWVDMEFTHLAPSTVHEFVTWASYATVDDLEYLRNQIAENCDELVIDELGRELSVAAKMDIAHLELTLAILGESRHPAAVAPLDRFVWDTSWGSVADVEPIDLSPGVIACDVRLNAGSAIRARAAEMLAFVGTSAAFEATLHVVEEHPEAAVRHAAIDAYLFNHQDSADAEELIHRHVRYEDGPWVAVPRRRADMNGKEFDERLKALHKSSPLPPLPEPIKDDQGHGHV